MAKKDNYIMYNGERLDLSVWVPMSVKAEEYGKSEGYFRKRVFRTRHNKTPDPIEFKDIPELKLTLVKR